MTFKALHFILLLFFCFVNSILSGQNSNINKSNDSLEIKHLFKKGLKYQNSLPDSSLFYAQKAFDLAKTNNNYEYIAKSENLIAVVYTNTGNYDKAIEHYIHSIKIFEKLNNVNGLVMTFTNIGTLNRLQKRYDKALEYYFKALNIVGKFTDKIDKNLKAQIYANIGIVYDDLKKYDQAIKYTQKTLEIAKKTGALTTKSVAYKNLSVSYEKLNEPQKAYYYYKLYKQIDDSLFNIEKNKQINELQLKYESSKKEKEINDKNTRIIVLEQIKKADNLKKNLLIGGILSVLILSYIYINGLRRRMKLNKQLFENKKLLNEKELENEKLKSIKLQKELELKESEIKYKNNEIEYKNQELVNFALNIAEKNELLEEIKDTLVNSKEPELSSKTIQIISRNQINLDEERRELHSKIELINQSFYMKLHQILPDISNTDEKLCALIRLKLSSKQIALTLNITPQSVDVYKHRLRKKFNLNKDINLNDFLNSL